jgi:predicted DNA repair protein MutK
MVTLDHNSMEYKDAVRGVDAVIEAVSADNQFGANAPEEKEALLATLKAGRQLLNAVQVRVAAVASILLPALRYVADHFTKGAITTLGAAAAAAVAKLLGLF